MVCQGSVSRWCVEMFCQDVHVHDHVHVHDDVQVSRTCVKMVSQDRVSASTYVTMYMCVMRYMCDHVHVSLSHDLHVCHHVIICHHLHMSIVMIYMCHELVLSCATNLCNIVAT